MLHVAILHSGGAYQERLREYLQAQPGARVEAFQVPANLPVMMDEEDAAALIPPAVAQADVVIAVNLHPALLAELPYVMAKGRAKALLVPREDPAWVRPGQVHQVTRTCGRFGIESAFPKPFCQLEPLTPLISQFCEEYQAGRPQIELECRAGRIVAARCLRSSPCGLTAWVTEQLPGRPCDDSLVRALAELLHLRPCLASMALDEELGDTVMHESIRIIEQSGRRALQAAQEVPVS